MQTVYDIISLWPRRADLASDVGVSVDAVHKWAQAGSIPARYQLGVLSSARQRGFDLTADDMVAAHAVNMQLPEFVTNATPAGKGGAA